MASGDVLRRRCGGGVFRRPCVGLVVVRLARALVLAPLLFVGCSHLSSPSASADLTRGDPFTCEQTGDRLCIGHLWLYVKFALTL